MPWQRRPFNSRDPSRVLNISDLRDIARRRIPGFVFEYVEGGAEDEQTLRCNRRAFEAISFVPRTLVDTTARHHKIELFGRPAAAPLIIGPTGMNGMIDRHGDTALARGAAAAGIPFCLSTVSTTRLEDVASSAGGRLWMQLYVMKDRAVAEDIMKRADAAGYEALVFTTDANVFGSREWDRRNYWAPGKPTFRTKLDILRHPRWLRDVLLREGMPRFRNFESFLPPGASTAVGGSTIIPKLFAPSITWDDIAWIRRHWPRKLIVKGVLSVSDAQRAADLGCDGIVLTNHGGRQLDSCVAPIQVLPDIAAAVGQRMTIIVDSGFRRGTDVVKALAKLALGILQNEIDRVLGQLGVRSVSELGPQILRRS
jgi:(S)-mandelate dehydrogenase